jgi:hypothetical protein
MHLRPGTRRREDKAVTEQAVTEQSTQVDEGNPLPEPPQLPPEPEPQPEPEPEPPPGPTSRSSVRRATEAA